MSSWKQFVVRGDRWQGPGVRWQAGDDSGRISKAALGQGDNPLLTHTSVSTVVTGRTGPTFLQHSRGSARVPAGFNRNNISGDRTDS